VERANLQTVRNLVFELTQAREQIIAASIPMLKQGMATDEIGALLGVSGRTLRHWLIADENAKEARTEFLSGKILQAAEDIENADSALPLARAREGFRVWAWLGERRLPDVFGAKTELRGSKDSPLFDSMDRSAMLMEIARSLAITLQTGVEQQPEVLQIPQDIVPEDDVRTQDE
jgi:hypothetical protein